jgi:hypothetical protein
MESGRRILLRPNGERNTRSCGMIIDTAGHSDDAILTEAERRGLKRTLRAVQKNEASLTATKDNLALAHAGHDDFVWPGDLLRERCVAKQNAASLLKYCAESSAGRETPGAIQHSTDNRPGAGFLACPWSRLP